MIYLAVLLGAILVSAGIYYGAMTFLAWRESLPLTVPDLRKISYLSTLDDEHLSNLLKLVHEIRVEAGTWLIREHEGGDALYYVISGEVDILKQGTVGQTLVEKVREKEFIGEMALLCGTKRVASARATVSSTLLKIVRSDFSRFINADSHISESVWTACDIHSIHLTMTDNERLRSLAKPERENWLSQRICSFQKSGDLITFSKDSFLCLVAGSAEISGRMLMCPVMVPVFAGQSIQFGIEGRMALLPVPG